MSEDKAGYEYQLKAVRAETDQEKQFSAQLGACRALAAADRALAAAVRSMPIESKLRRVSPNKWCLTTFDDYDSMEITCGETPEECFKKAAQDE